ncbi:MAG: TetR/AcrR family transcriptional regulator [Desulfosalsimonas sp.]
MGKKERRERERQQRRAQILNAARALLLKDGFAGTSVNKISEKAELSIGSIYFYFKNKEEIFASLQKEGLEILHACIVSETEKTADCRQKLKMSAEAYYRFSRDHSDYFDVINYFLSSPKVFFSEDVKRTIDSKGATMLDYLADIVRDGVREGVFEESNPGSFAVCFWASLHGLIRIRKLKGITMEFDDFDSFYSYSTDRLIESLKR